jgi:hypothetical protein
VGKDGGVEITLTVMDLLTVPTLKVYVVVVVGLTARLPEDATAPMSLLKVIVLVPALATLQDKYEVSPVLTVNGEATSEIVTGLAGEAGGFRGRVESLGNILL